MITVQEKIREGRKKYTSEDFTPDKLVCQMLSKLPKENWKENKTFVDPAVGNGQLLIWALIYKIHLGHNPTDALKTLYGADIFNENVNECRLRLLKIVKKHQKIKEEHVEIVLKNIHWLRTDLHPNGALDYNFEFDHEIKKERVEKFMENIKKGIIKSENIKIPSDACVEENFKSTFYS